MANKKYIDNPFGEPESASVIESIIYPYAIEESYNEIVLRELKFEQHIIKQDKEKK